MLKKILTGWFFLITSIGSSSALAAPYANLSLGLTDVDVVGSGMAIAAGGGMEIPDLDFTEGLSLAAEGEFTASLVNPSKKVNGVEISTSYFTIGGYGVISYAVIDKLKVRGRVGLLYEDAEAEAVVLGNKVKADDSDVQFTFGGGLSYSIMKNIAATVDFTFIESDIWHLMGGARYSFK
jgi:opacity protein-like surface antigen